MGVKPADGFHIYIGLQQNTVTILAREFGVCKVHHLFVYTYGPEVGERVHEG